MNRLLLNVQNNSRIYWAAGPAMYLRKPAQFTDTFILLPGSKPKLSTTIQPLPSRRDIQRERSGERVQKRSSGWRNEKFVVVVQLDVAPADRERCPCNRAQIDAQEASSSSTPYDRRCSVYLTKKHTTDKRFSVSEKKLVAISEANWKNFLVFKFHKTVPPSPERVTTEGHPQGRPRLWKPRNKGH